MDILALCIFTEATPAVGWEFANKLAVVLLVHSRWNRRGIRSHEILELAHLSWAVSFFMVEGFLKFLENLDYWFISKYEAIKRLTWSDRLTRWEAGARHYISVLQVVSSPLLAASSWLGLKGSILDYVLFFLLSWLVVCREQIYVDTYFLCLPRDGCRGGAPFPALSSLSVGQAGFKAMATPLCFIGYLPPFTSHLSEMYWDLLSADWWTSFHSLP